MDDVIDSFQKLTEVLFLRNVRINDLSRIFERLNVFALTRGKVIDDFDGLIPAEKFLDDVRPDKPPAPRDHVHCHRYTSTENHSTRYAFVVCGRQTVSRILCLNLLLAWGPPAKP